MIALSILRRTLSPGRTYREPAPGRGMIRGVTQSALVAIALAVFGWAVVSEWLAARNVTGPLILVAAGFVLANPDWGVVAVNVDSSTVHSLAEITLALLLFADASKVRVRAARDDLPITARLLGIGLPLTFLAGLGIAVLL